MDHFEVTNLSQLMLRTNGRSEVVIGLIDGPVVADHPDLPVSRIRRLSGGQPSTCGNQASMACHHGTFTAGMLCARRGASAPAICSECTLLVRPVFPESVERGGMPTASPRDLAAAIVDCVNNGARVLNLSLALTDFSPSSPTELSRAIELAMARGVMVVAASGNNSTVGSSGLTRHPWVIPVSACDSVGRPLSLANIAASTGRTGLRAPGENITSLRSTGGSQTLSGTSVAVPFVAGTIALLMSEFPKASAMQIKQALTRSSVGPRNAVVPPLLNAMGAHQALAAMRA